VSDGRTATASSDAGPAPAASPGRSAPRPHLAHGRWTPLFFVAPAVIALLVIGIYPTIFALVTSFRRYNLTRARDGFPFVGLENYRRVLSDQTFWETLGRTAGFFLSVVPVALANIRTQMSAAHSREDLEQAVAAFERTGRALGVIE